MGTVKEKNVGLFETTPFLHFLSSADSQEQGLASFVLNSETDNDRRA